MDEKAQYKNLETASTLIHAPLSFVRSGRITTSEGEISKMGVNGFNWSIIAESDTNAYRLNMDVWDVYPFHYDTKWRGLPLRRLYIPSAFPFIETYTPLSIVVKITTHIKHP